MKVRLYVKIKHYKTIFYYNIIMSFVSDQKKIKISEKERRAKLREELGDKEYTATSTQKKEYRAKMKASKTPQKQQQQIIKNVIEKVVINVTPEVIKQVITVAKGKITIFFKPITKEQYLNFFKNEPVKDLMKEINTTIKRSNDKAKNSFSDNIKNLKT